MVLFAVSRPALTVWLHHALLLQRFIEFLKQG